MTDPRIQSFAEFWPYYVGEHRSPLCRALHFIGSSLALAAIAAAVVLQSWWILLAAPIAGYGFAWTGHFFVEKNKPASFRYPLWSFIADWKMWAYTLTGRMAVEVERTLAATR